MANRSPEPMSTQRSLSILTASLVIGSCAGCLSFLATGSASAACTARWDRVRGVRPCSPQIGRVG